jgi:hypothetical protein
MSSTTSFRHERSVVCGLQQIRDRAAHHHLAGMTPMRPTSKSASDSATHSAASSLDRSALLALVEQRDRGHRQVAHMGDLVGDEAGLLNKRFGEIAIDSMHELIERALSDAVRPDAHVRDSFLSWRMDQPRSPTNATPAKEVRQL